MSGVTDLAFSRRSTFITRWLSMSWSMFLGLVLLLYFLSNIVFGTIYASFGEKGLVDATDSLDGLFISGFFFSVQTFATIGYGTLHVVGIVPNLVVTVESYYSLIANALITGLVFARFRGRRHGSDSAMLGHRTLPGHYCVYVSDRQWTQQPTSRGQGTGHISPVRERKRKTYSQV